MSGESVRTHLDPEHVIQIHKGIGPDYEEKIIRPAIRSVIRLVTSEYAVMDVYSAKRAVIQDEISPFDNRCRPSCSGKQAATRTSRPLGWQIEWPDDELRVQPAREPLPAKPAY